MTRRRVLLVQPSMQPPGGGNGVAAWMLQALAPHHAVTVLSWWPVELAPINRFFGTSLRTGDFDTVAVPPSWRQAVDRLPVPASLLRSSLLMRFTRRLVDRFDLVIGAHNETDYGRRGIQYVHYPTYLRPRPEVDLRWYHWEPALHAYYAVADRLAGFSPARMRANVTLANSAWTAAKIAGSLGITAEVVYPPVVGCGRGMAWHERRREFVAMGRISPEKEYERIIRILAAVKRRHPEIVLTIVGTVDDATRGYFQSVQRVVTSLDASSWVTFRPNLPREEVCTLLSSLRYGIHGMREEHFGMAPAEMARAGMLVWVPDGGGQVEIVGDAPLLRYATDEQAIDAITRVLAEHALEHELRDRLRASADLFSADRFMQRIREIVDVFPHSS